MAPAAVGADKPGTPFDPNCRACSSFQDFLKLSSRKSTSAAGLAQRSSTGSAAASQQQDMPCPPDSLELGRHTWTFLHSMAAYYPEQPSVQTQQDMRTLIEKFSLFYPCGYCAEHLREELKVHPPETQSREALSRWMCNMHNGVNARLDKPAFDCSKVLERWFTGPPDGRCG